MKRQGKFHNSSERKERKVLDVSGGSGVFFRGGKFSQSVRE